MRLPTGRDDDPGRRRRRRPRWRYRRGRSEVTVLRLLDDVSQVALLPLDPDDTLREIMRRVRNAIGADTATIMLRDPENALRPRATVGLEAELDAQVRVPVGAGLSGWVAASGEPLLIDDIGDAAPVSPFLAAAGLHSLAAVPLTAGGVVIGVLHVGSRTRSRFTDAHLTVLSRLSDRVTQAVERVRAEEREQLAVEALRDSEHRARAVLEAAVDAVITMDERGRIESVNPATERLFGYTAAELVGASVAVLMPEPDRSRHDDHLEAYRRTGERHVIGIGREVTGQRRDGQLVPLELAVAEVTTSGGRLFTGFLRDISERKAFEARLAQEALHDPLTGLGNRALLRDRLQHAMDRFPRAPGLLAVFYLDLDDFKEVNDSLGHGAGDQLLVEVAARLTDIVRPADTVIRLGGDEFVVLSEDLPDPGAAERLAARIVAALQRPFVLSGGEAFVSTSVGVTLRGQAASPDDVIRDADAAMYAAKSAGKSGYAVFDQSMRAAATRRVELKAALHHAAQAGELRVHYQPLVDLDAGHIIAVEALLRWQHPTLGLLTPGDFLHLAEDNQLIVDLDTWVLHTACRQAITWEAALRRPLSVWVNLAARTLADPRLPTTVAAACAAAGLPPDRLNLEITENALMRDPATTQLALTRLKQIGVRLVVDDFGTGYSSLAYLRRFPVDAVKIDRSFVGDLDRDTSNQAVVRAVTGLAADLGIDSLAEGLETPAELDTAVRLGCQLGQGFHLGRPATPDQIVLAAAEPVGLPRDLALLSQGV